MVKTISVIVASLLALVTMGYLLTMVLVKPIGTDLTVVGKGKPVLVLAYENFSPSGGEALNLLRQVSDDYASRLEFVVADLGTPQGREFASRYDLGDGDAVFLKKDGQPLQVTRIPVDEQTLRNRLEATLVAAD